EAEVNSRKSRLDMLKAELDKQEEDFAKLTVKADRAGLVIYKTTRRHWQQSNVSVSVGEEIKQGFRDLAKEVPTAVEELMKIGERVINLQRMFNMREGFSRKDDMIPERMKKVPSFGIYKDENRCGISDYEAMLNEYYEARGWDLETGAPSKDKLDELGI
ncbi:hypothetical protein LCGC14_2162760, partial [marine sediment metagenome]